MSESSSSASYKNLLVLASPLIAAQLAQMGMEIVDTIMIGHLGKYQLASAALSGPTYISILVFFIGVLSAVGVHIARDLGAKKPDSIRQHLYHGVLLAILISLPAMFIVWMIPALLELTQQDPQIVHYSREYLHAVVLGIPGFLIYIALREYTTAMLFPRIVMWLSIGAIPINAVLNYIFIYGYFGMPELGIAGAGIATALVDTLLPLALYAYIRYTPALKIAAANLFKQSFHITIFKEYWRIGWPVGTTLTFEVGLFAVASVLMGYFGTESLAAHQIALQSSSVAFMFFLGISQAVGIQLSHAVGAGQTQLLKRLCYNGIRLGMGIAFMTALLFLFFPELIAEVFLDAEHAHNQEVLHFTVIFLQVAAIFQFSDAAQVILNGALRGLKDTFVPMLLGLLSYWLIGIAVGAISAFYFGLNGTGLWIGLTVGLTASGLLLWWRFLTQLKHFPTAAK